MTWSTRYATARMERFFDEGERALTVLAQQKYTEAAEGVAEWWSGKIPAGRGGSHNSEMKDIDGRVTQTKKGAFFVRMGWLNHPPMAEDGKTSWFVYHDTGYDPFGMVSKGYNASYVVGLMLQMDARRMLQDRLYNANDEVTREISRAARRQRGQ